MWILKANYKNGHKHEHLSLSVWYLQELLTAILRRGGNGIIIKEKD